MMARKAFLLLLLLVSFLSVYLFALFTTSILLISRSDPQFNDASSHDKPHLQSPSCDGRRIYVYNLPETFNIALLKRCRELKRGIDLCSYMQNSGMGKEAEFEIDGEDRSSKCSPWFSTWQFSLEIYVHERLKKYPCRTDVESDAIAFYVPYYAGMDLLYRTTHRLPREALSLDLLQWLESRPSWKRHGGRDHFITLGRIARDFRMPPGSSWGSQMLLHPGWESMVKLTLERDGTRESAKDREIAIPYPTFFHPADKAQVQALAAWLSQSKQRVSLACMAGRTRKRTAGFRQRLFDQCEQDHRCSLLLCLPDAESQSTEPVLSHNQTTCRTKNVNCSVPSLLEFFHGSNFCLQPAGDSPSRRSFFDVMLAGCIPVIFNLNSAWTQYMSHLPANGSSYSIYIHPSALRKQSLFDILQGVPKWQVHSIREKIAELLPRISYSHILADDHRLMEDAFDLAITAVLAKMRDARANFDELSLRISPL